MLRELLQPLEREDPPRLLESGSDIHIPITIPAGAERDAVVRSIADQVMAVLDLLEPQPAVPDEDPDS
ncbi:MAG: hypothetical protein QGH45_21580 [Myxococcota bacterium]|nr:hypothetical protein [Myxococcota bacterium]